MTASVKNLTGQSGTINTIRMIDSLLFASGSSDSSIYVWNTTYTKKIRALIGHDGPVTSLDIFKRNNAHSIV